MANGGWIKLHRKLLDNEELMRSDNAYKLFTVLLLLADRNGKWSGGRFQLANFSRLKNSSTYKALLRLKNLKIVTLESNNKYTDISICNWSTYQGDSNTKEEQQSNNKVTTEEQQSSTLTRMENGRIENKENTQSPIEIGGDTNKAIKLFGSLNPSYEQLFKRKNQRDAVERLIKKFSLDELEKLIEAARQANGMEFAPTITTPCQLEDKLGQLKSFYDKNKNNKKGVRNYDR